MPTLPAILLLTVLLAGTIAGVHRLGGRFGWTEELQRKLVHILLGLACLSFPWLFEGPRPVVWLALATTAVLLLLRLVPALRHGPGQALHGVERQSLGDLLFPASVAVLFAISGEHLELYLIPVGLLTFADPAGALVGRRWGKTRFKTGQGNKTLEGSLAVFLVALAVAIPGLIVLTPLPTLMVVAIGLLLAGLSAVAEAACDHGSDNAVLPLGSSLVLAQLEQLPWQVLPARIALLGFLLVALLLLRRYTSLDTGALLAAALLGYALATLGGPAFLLPALLVFSWHLASTAALKRRRRDLSRHQRATLYTGHRVDVVLAFACGTVPLLALVEGEHTRPISQLALAMGLSCAFQLTLLRLGTACWLGTPPRLWSTPLLAIPVCVVPALLPFWLRLDFPEVMPWTLLAWPLLSGLGFLFLALRGTSREPRPAPWILHGALVFTALPLWLQLARPF